ncbi:hypothetical protein [Dictyobacter arantiisoli]|uniref:hypothetical protein n=1 Tax=Dictyobacter arantiisoli TaxID=2014874 RepID=UPI0011ECCF79|nr:hypothetical protein [Dictyobacter arantiisoli]
MDDKNYLGTQLDVASSSGDHDIPFWSWRPLLLIGSLSLFYIITALFTHVFRLPLLPVVPQPSQPSALRHYFSAVQHVTGTFSGSHFIYLANGWLQGHLYINQPVGGTGDYTFFHGHWYVAFPPLPAVFFLPLVAIFHYTHQLELSLGVALFFGIVNIVLMFFVLQRLPVLAFAHIAWLLSFFALGTELFFVTMQASVWFLAHVIATTFLLCYLLELIGPRRGWLAALWLGLAALSRSTVLLAFPSYLILIYLSERQKPRLMWQQVLTFSCVLGAFVTGMLLYNLARFGSLLDFGYLSMNVSPRLSYRLHTYGQFSLHFLSTNMYYMFIQPPQFLTIWPYLQFNPWGTSIFWTMPALYRAVRVFLAQPSSWLPWGMLGGCILPLGAILLYFNTGWYQFGFRFVLDILPFLFVLAVFGYRGRLPWYDKGLIGLSIGLNLWGWMDFRYFPPLH